MAIHGRRAQGFLREILADASSEEFSRRLDPRHGDHPPAIPKAGEITPEIVDRRWEILGDPSEIRRALLDPQTLEQMAGYGRNIENFIGTVNVPLGIAGPLRVNGLFAHGDFYVPLATTEAALPDLRTPSTLPFDRKPALSFLCAEGIPSGISLGCFITDTRQPQNTNIMGMVL